MSFFQDSDYYSNFLDFELAARAGCESNDGDLDADQEAAFDAIANGHNVHVAGKAGVGKSYLLKYLQRELGKHKTIVFLAPSALAASNVGGQTIHSFFGFPIGPLTKGFDRWNEECFQMIREVDTLIVDEASMLRADSLAAIDRIMRVATESDEVFGGKQICVVGDFHQLPPVVATKVEYELLREEHGGPYCFQTEVWQRADFQTVMLSIVHRQPDECLFVDLLNTIRNGDVFSPNFELRDFFGSRMMSCIEALNRSARITSVPGDHRLTTLCMTRKAAKAVNQREHKRVIGPMFTSQATVSGAFDVDKHPTQQRLELKIGSRVIVIANGYGCVNGDQGEVVAIDPDSEVVVVALDSGRQVGIGPYVWTNTVYALGENEVTGRKEVTEKVVGTFKQYPLMLSYAISVHRSQGMTLDRVHVDLSSRPFCAGQLYVALSRCRSIKTLSLSRHIYPTDVRQDHRVLDFYQGLAPKKEPMEWKPIADASGAEHEGEKEVVNF